MLNPLKHVAKFWRAYEALGRRYALHVGVLIVAAIALWAWIIEDNVVGALSAIFIAVAAYIIFELIDRRAARKFGDTKPDFD